MNLLSIKIKIGDREYPMKVAAEDEHRIRSAAKMLNERIKSYREQFGLNDKTDLLAMVAFDSTMEGLKIEQETTSLNNQINQKVERIITLLDS